MSKSSSGNDDINIAYLEKLTESVADVAAKLEKISPSYGANGVLEQTIRDLVKHVQSGDMTLKQMLKEAAATQKNIRSVEYGLGDTTRYTKTINLFLKLLEDKIKDSDFDEVLIKKLTTAFENLDVSAILESEKIGVKGGKGAPLKNTLDNEKLNKVNADLAEKIGVKLDTVSGKLMAFFQEQTDKEVKKKKKQLEELAEDLIEGLGKSKWVGGAINDIFKLMGLLGGQWLSQFGKFGKVLGGAFYVAMELFGPQLAKILGKAFLKGIGSLSKSLANLIVGLSSKFGGPLSMFSPGKWNMMSTAGKVSSVGRLAATGLVAGAAIGVGTWAGSQAVDSWKQGRKGNAAAFGIGGAALIGGGIAALVAGLTAPITVPLLAIGGAVVGIAAAWKFHSETIKKWGAKLGEFINKVIDFMALWNPIFMVIKWMRENWPWWLGGKGGGKGDSIGGNNSNKGTGITDSLIDNSKENYVTYGKMKVSKRDGSILNLASLSQEEASQALQMYEKADPTSFNKVYEWLGADKASLSSHSTDAVKKVNGITVAALSKKGTSDEIDALRAQLIANGMSQQKAAEFVQTSGKLTGSNIFHGAGGWKSHNNPYALGIDLAGGQSWTAQDYKDNYQAIKDYYKALGYEVTLEEPGQGKSTGWHYDIKPMKNIRPAGAQENFSRYEEAQKVVAENVAKKMQVPGELLKAIDQSKFDEVTDYRKGATDKNMQGWYEKELNKLNIYRDTGLKGNPFYYQDPQTGATTLLTGTQGQILTDVNGNAIYEKIFGRMSSMEAIGADGGRP